MFLPCHYLIISMSFDSYWNKIFFVKGSERQFTKITMPQKKSNAGLESFIFLFLSSLQLITLLLSSSSSFLLPFYFFLWFSFCHRWCMGSVKPRPRKGRHVATVACPWVDPSFSGSIQGLVRHMISQLV